MLFMLPPELLSVLFTVSDHSKGVLEVTDQLLEVLQDCGLLVVCAALEKHLQGPQ